MGLALAFAVQFLYPTFPAKREQAEGAQRSEEWARPRPADAFVCSWVGVGSSPLMDGQLPNGVLERSGKASGGSGMWP